MAESVIEQLENELNSLDSFDRADALCSLSVRAEMGDIALPRTTNESNLHLHTFFSYNKNGWSPSRIAWEAAKRGLLVAGIVDSDVLDGMEEFLAAGELIHLRTTAALETRAFVREFFNRDIHFRDEPGIAYFMAAGCVKQPSPGSDAHDTLRLLREMAERRNVQAMERVNAYLESVKLDYEADVISLTPSGNATEWHLVSAYDAKARDVFAGNEDSLVEFWADKLGMSEDETRRLINDKYGFPKKLHEKLTGFGGVGHVAPAAGSVLSIEQAIEMTKGLQGIPTAVWRYKNAESEADISAVFDLLSCKGVAAINIEISVEDSAETAANDTSLKLIIEAAREVDWPISIGTGMDIAAMHFDAELEPYLEDLIDGANFFWGHTVLARNLDMGYASEWADHHFGDDRVAKNNFFTNVGKLVSPHEANLLSRSNLRTGTPFEVLRALQR